MILLIGGEKGGTGKSCLAQHLAVYFSMQDNTNVILVDCDPQHSTSDWVQLRHLQPGLSWINAVQMYGKIRYELKSLQHHYDYVIVDCGAHDAVALRSAMAVATHVLLPLQPKVRDLATIPHLSDLIQNCVQINPQMQVACVLNQCPVPASTVPGAVPGTAPADERVLQARTRLQAANLTVLQTQIGQHDEFDSSALKGFSVLDTQPNGAAARDIIAVAQELLQSGLNQLSSGSLSATGTISG